MKKYTLLPLLLALSLLTGCGSLLERSYTAVTPHTQFSDESKNDAILRAETYQGLVSALLYLVEQGEETGTVRLYQYGSVTGTDVKQTPSYYQVEVKLAYAVDPEELSQVISVTGSTAVEQELRALLPDQPEKVVFRISYFTQEDSAETLRQAVQEAYQAQTRPLPPLLGVEVKLYPDSGQQRVAEILLTWQAREHQTVEDFLGNLKN